MIVNRSAPPGPIVPWLIYEDVDKAIRWLSGAFGFIERLRTLPEPDGTIHHAQLAVGEGSVVLTGRPGGVQPGSPAHSSYPPPSPHAFAQALFIAVENVDRHCERARQFGARILNEPRTCEFGERQYTAEDPAGNRWTFSQPVADVDPEQWGAKVSSLKSGPLTLPRPRWCYLQIPAVDIAVSVAFYEKIFGWNIRHRDTAHPSFDDATGQVSGSWVSGRAISSEPGLLPYIWVDGIDAVLTQITATGGEVVEGPHLDAPGGEWIATFRDPARNVIGLYQEGPR